MASCVRQQRREVGIEGSEVLEDLQEMEKDGLKILVGGTWLNHIYLLEKKQVGETTNMLDIVPCSLQTR